jgi:hypothetical protein
LDGLHKLHKLIPSTDKSAYVAIDLITKLRERNKLMRIADNSAGGWATVRENRIICCQIFCDLLLKSAFERIFNVLQLILVKIK